MRKIPLLVALAVGLGACSGTAGPVTSTKLATAAPATSAAVSSTSPASPSTTTTTLEVPFGVDPDSPCLPRAEFGDPAVSEYILPYPAGAKYYVTQSYCFSDGGHRGQLAYDFSLPIGADVVAARSGVVKQIREDSPDNGAGDGEHNYIFIQHDDGTVAFYAHLMQDGVAVDVGDEVVAGELIAYSGNSGLTGRPHLHFGVYRSWPPSEGRDVPVNFRNADGPLDARNGLIVGRAYEALPDE